VSASAEITTAEFFIVSPFIPLRTAFSSDRLTTLTGLVHRSHWVQVSIGYLAIRSCWLVHF